MEIEEHFYSDDPSIGHPDVRTRLSETEYFFLGNGRIHAAVQVCRSGQGTPLGLLVMNPCRFTPKRGALTMHPDSGLQETMVGLLVGVAHFRPEASALEAAWDEAEDVPTVRVTWRAGPATVVEHFSCPGEREPLLVRHIEVHVREPLPVPITLVMPLAEPPERILSFASHGRIQGPGAFSSSGVATATLLHEVRHSGAGPEVESGCPPDTAPGTDESRETSRGAASPEASEVFVETRWQEEGSRPTAFGVSHATGIAARHGGERPPELAVGFWSTLARLHSSHEGLNHLFRAARNQLPTAVDHRGRMDGSIWQYNLEWVRDQAHVAEALVRLGDPAKARTILARLLDEFVSPEGDTVDSGRRRPALDVELDQNGELLAALGTYVDWTGDLDLVKSRWERVRAVASFPFQDRFRHPASGLLHNEREYWERHGSHGIQDGFELMSQFFVALGLEKAAGLAQDLHHTQDRDRWRAQAARLRQGILENTPYRLVENGHLIKRRGTDGRWQRSIRVRSSEGLPRDIPLLQPGPHLLDPDASAALPVAYGFIDPGGTLARNTLAHLEELWNPWWKGGGYGRYHPSSEPDSPGAWPFASLFIARAYVEAGDDEKVWRTLRWLLHTPGGRAGAWFENDGPRIAPPYPQVGIPPWTWAEIITLFLHHLLGIRPDGRGITLRPRLLRGLHSMEASLVVRGHPVHLCVRRIGPGEERSVLAGGHRLVLSDAGVRIPLPETATAVEILC